MDMEKIELPDECKVILLAISRTGFIMPNHMDDTDKWLDVFQYMDSFKDRRTNNNSI